MRLLIYGAGSLGTVFGAYLSKAGTPVTLVTRNRAHVEALRKNGATLTGTVQMCVPVKACFPEEIEETYDIIFLFTKQLENESVAEFLRPHLAEDGVLCTFQNGLPEVGLSKILGDERVVGCTVAWGATLTGPGVCEVTSDPNSFSFSLGCISDKAENKLENVKKYLQQMCTVELEKNFMGARWAKLLINAAFSGMGAALGTTFGGCTKPTESRRYVQRVIKECIDVTAAAGIRIEPVQGKDIVKLMDYHSVIKQKIAFLLLPLVIKKHRLIKPSMLQDLEKGKRCEVDAINGVVCDFGDRYNVGTPVCDTIVSLIHRVERGEERCCMENLQYFKSL